MACTRHGRAIAASACIAVGVIASALVRRAGNGSATIDHGREAFLDERRERMRVARIALLAPNDRGA
jgi:hypothetical protein